MTKEQLLGKMNELEAIFARSRELMCEIMEAVSKDDSSVSPFSLVPQEITGMSVKEFMFKYSTNSLVTVRAINCLRAEGCNTVEDITRLTAREILRMRNSGRHTLSCIVGALNRVGLKLTA